MTASLIIASNRGPAQFVRTSSDRITPHRGGGGLVTAVGPAMADRDGLWIAAAISDADRAVAARHNELRVLLPEGDTRLRLLTMDPEVYDDFYNEIGNRVLWPLNHRLFDLARAPLFDEGFRRAWGNYRSVNNRFAQACAASARPAGSVFVQDYHLTLAPALLRRARPDLHIAHYTHCPWPAPDYFSVLPVGRELVTGMLGADLLCFEVPRWAANFRACCQALGHEVTRTAVHAPDGREVQIRSYPLGVDAAELHRAAAGPVVSERRAELRAALGRPRLIVRIDRLEPAKNLLRGLDAYATVLERRPRLHGEVVHVVLAYASRETVPEYRAYAHEVSTRISEINHRFGTANWQPIFFATNDDYPRSLAAMRLADVFVVNPLWDGQNMVAKEGPVINERDAPLLLSRNAGAADDLACGALLVNPFDVSESADVLETALDMGSAERSAAARRVRAGAVRNPPASWFGRQERDLHDAVAARLRA